MFRKFVLFYHKTQKQILGLLFFLNKEKNLAPKNIRVEKLLCLVITHFSQNNSFGQEIAIDNNHRPKSNFFLVFSFLEDKFPPDQKRPISPHPKNPCSLSYVINNYSLKGKSLDFSCPGKEREKNPKRAKKPTLSFNELVLWITTGPKVSF